MRVTSILTQSNQGINNQNNQPLQRRKTAVLPKRSWVQRNPRLFSIIFITTSLLTFFSKPIYDSFIVQQLPPPPQSLTNRYYKK
ncbi:uncharacterized protein LOC129612590 [Condylostylus longicornis]|uniref:uncharacterized protein LOC129612590 n=1 Tax=Condylostylus longicornis TaxID=2530218 RepID=UPI00244DC3F5|nr:uncharacterized protein LOC129612590 [Condylostylus longicornis]